MAITFRHDAAGVSLPSTNNAGRKYGQELILQQQQQKYQAQERGLDRWYNAASQQSQNMFQLGRDQQQNAFQVGRAKQQNAFQMDMLAQQQKEAEAERQRAFLDDARKQSGGFIMDSIKNGEYDPATARKLQQNLVAEAEALGNPGLDATQRAEALQKIRAERAMLSANRMELPPKPTAQEQFNQGIVTDPDTGMRYRQNSKGDYEPIPQQQQAPSSATEAFGADPKLRDKYMAEAKEMLTKKDEFGNPLPLTRDSRKEAAEMATKLWEDDNLPTAAPTMPGSPPAAPRTEQSILESSTGGIPIAPPDPGRPPGPVPQAAGPIVQSPDAGQPPSPLQQKQALPLVANSGSQNPWAEMAATEQPQAPPATGQVPPTSAAEYDAEMTSKGYKLTTPADGSRPYYFKDFGSGTAQPGETMPQAPAQGNASALPTVTPPDFGKLVESAQDDGDRVVLGQLQEVYGQAKSPDIQHAIAVFVSPDSLARDAANAKQYLKSQGIDLDQMIAEFPDRAEKIKGVQDKNQERFGNRRDFEYGF